jgi:nucleotide-binding universal stress UspA family protein
MKILIEYDGSKAADKVLEDMQYAGLPREATAKIVSIVEPITLAGMPEAAWIGTYVQVTENEIRQSRIAIEAACEQLSALHPDWELDYEAYLGRTEEEILDLAKEWKPDLLVISPMNGNEGLGLYFGNLSRSIVERSSCSVRVARPADKRDGNWPRLLIGFDGSAGAVAAVREVASRCWPGDAQVRIVAGFKSSLFSPTEPFDTEKAHHRTRLEAAIGMLQAAGLEVSSVIREGRAKQVILSEATKFGAHCIFLGSEDGRSLRRLFLGSTSSAIASGANCTVEVVRDNARRLVPMNATYWVKAANSYGH